MLIVLVRNSKWIQWCVRIHNKYTKVRCMSMRVASNIIYNFFLLALTYYHLIIQLCPCLSQLYYFVIVSYHSRFYISLVVLLITLLKVLCYLFILFFMFCLHIYVYTEIYLSIDLSIAIYLSIIVVFLWFPHHHITLVPSSWCFVLNPSLISPSLPLPY